MNKAEERLAAAEAARNEASKRLQLLKASSNACEAEVKSLEESVVYWRGYHTACVRALDDDPDPLFAGAIALLKREWEKLQPGRYQTMLEDEVDASWYGALQHAIDVLKKATGPVTVPVPAPGVDRGLYILLDQLRTAIGEFREKMNRPRLQKDIDELDRMASMANRAVGMVIK